MKPDRCQLCARNDAVWIVLDSKRHAYHSLYLTEDLSPDLKKELQEDAYLTCVLCRRQVEQQNKRSKRPRSLRFIGWKDADG